MEITPIAHIENGFQDKFGIPRQSGLVTGLLSEIVFAKDFRNPDALRGIEGYSHIWLVFGFSESVREGFTPTVRPPRLGGNQKMGVFATRSPFRPNSLGLSSVKLVEVKWDTPRGAVLVVDGADLLDGTPIYDIKPYLPFADSHPDAIGGFADAHKADALTVEFDRALCPNYTDTEYTALLEILRQDPRPSYQNDPTRIYGLPYGGYDIRFQVSGDSLTVVAVVKN
jgi:tRNA-Thr(GGU) m(6)t(6)A37 methyltransferase TsaA